LNYSKCIFLIKSLGTCDIRTDTPFVIQFECLFLYNLLPWLYCQSS
ncbi:uncharacterized protein METZ01_LOCUS368731, partial [marine metagenome]